MMRLKCKYCADADWKSVGAGIYYEPFANDGAARFCLYRDKVRWQICCETHDGLVYFADINRCPVCGRRLNG